MKILLATSRFPMTGHTGDRLRAVRQIEYLSRSHEVHLVCLTRFKVGDAARSDVLKSVASLTVIPHTRSRLLRNALRIPFSSLPLQSQLFLSQPMAEAVSTIVRSKRIDVVLTQLVRIAPNIDTGHTTHVLDFVDALSLGLDRRHEVSRVLPFRVLLRHEANRLRRLELDTAKRVGARVITSPVDANYLHALGSEHIDVVPVGVADEFFTYDEDMAEADDYDLIFTGNLGYSANITAAQYLAKRVLPELHERVPTARLAIVGARPARRVRRLANDRITVLGPVDDLKPFMRRAKVAIAPMFSGSGLQLKLLEAMAMGLPVVTTPVANQALGATPGQHLLVGTSAKELAAAAQRLLEDRSFAERLATAGREYVAERFHWDVVNRQLELHLEAASSVG